MIKSSEEIDKLATALSAFQGEVNTVSKNSQGFGYKYANLESVLESIQKPLTKAGLSVIQFPINTPEGGMGVFTRLQHNSGQFICSQFTSKIIDKGDINKNCQAHGSLITYYRRYALLSVLNLAACDDDGALAKEEFSNTKPTEQKKNLKKGDIDKNQKTPVKTKPRSEKAKLVFKECSVLINSMVRDKNGKIDELRRQNLRNLFETDISNNGKYFLEKIKDYGKRDLDSCLKILNRIYKVFGNILDVQKKKKQFSEDVYEALESYQAPLLALA